jgi:septal ring factor EnvC (AmiA/AmiB activator)
MIVLQALLRNISQTNFSLQQEVKELNKIHTELDAKKQVLANNLESYQKRYQEVEDLLKKRRTIVDKELYRRKDMATKVTTLADSAKSLEELIKHLETEPLTTPPKDFTKKVSVANLLKCRPIVGKIVAHFGQKHTASPAGKGLVLETTSQSHVVSPFDAQVVYAGPFRTYKDILILAHGTDYHALLIGMDRVDASLGQTVLAGEPVGRMSHEPQPKLYSEVRHKGKPINPLT